MSDSPFTSKRGLIKMGQQRQKALNMSMTLTGNELQLFMDQTLPQNISSSGYFAANSTVPLGYVADTFSERHSRLDYTSDQQQSIFKERTNMLFPQFLEVLQARTNDSEVFDTIQDLIHTCSGVLDETKKELKRPDGGGERQQKMSAVTWLDKEVRTWKLLYALYKDRIMLQGDHVDSMDYEVPPLGVSEKEVIAQLYTCNSTLREYQLIVDWLEACYERSDGGMLARHTLDHTVGWENTLFQLQSQKEVAFGASGVEIVKSLDPDAPIREKRPLHALDEEDNMRLSRCIFTEIRQGRIDEAMALCKYCGQTWRAAILEGWRLHEDPNYELPQNIREKMPIDGNPRRDVWKKCAWMMANSKKCDEYTRAIAGVFCGHLESLKALLADSWEDLLWAYLKVQIDIRVESEMRSCCMKPYHQMPNEYWNSKMSMEQIFEELSVHKDAAVRDYAASKVGVIQKYLILDNIAELLLQIRQWVDESNSGDDGEVMSSHFLRFLTHIVLFMRQIGRVDKEDTADCIIAAYVESLIEMGDAQLVAFYTAALPSKLQVLLYSKFLQSITESAARSTAIEEAINAGLDIENITRHTVESIRQRLPDADTEQLKHEQPKGGDISAFDQSKIRGLEWLTFLPAQRCDLLWQANAMTRTFLGESKTECVRAVYEMVPNDSIAQILSIYGSKENFPCREECSIKEHLSYKVYLAALDCFNEWSQLYHNRPKAPQQVHADANFTERVASEHKEQTYRMEMNRWNSSLEEQTRITRDALYNILLFPDKGWLVDPDTAKEPVDVNELDWENRQIQLEKLQSICIPEIVLLLHKVLHQSGDYQGCIKLADDIASETRQLYQVYTKHKLAELLSQIAESSLELLNSKQDPWGYPATI